MSKAESTGMSRRDLLRRGTAAGIAVGGVGYGSLRLDHGPVQNSQAIAPIVAAGAIGGSVAVGWALREFEVVGSNPPAEGLTAGSLHSQVYDRARTRQSTNKSTFIDNRNILHGIENSAYADAKIAAIEELNNQSTKSAVQESAVNTTNDYEATILKNLFKSYSEAANELATLAKAVKDHKELNQLNVFDNGLNPGGTEGWSYYEDSDTTEEWRSELETHTVTLPNDAKFDIKCPTFYSETDWGGGASDVFYWSPVDTFGDIYAQSASDVSLSYGQGYVQVNSTADSSLRYLDHSEWNDLYTAITDKFQNVRDGIAKWVDGVYSEVQSGSIDTSELLTPREQAELTSDDEEFPQAIADLQALNVSVDLDREAEVYLPDSDATIYGNLAYTGDTTLDVGVIDPNATEEDSDGNEVDKYSGTFYLTYDISRGEGTWSDYETGVDGGVVTFTSEPYEDSLFNIVTTVGETAEVTRSDFEENSDGDYEVDISDQVENSITEIDAVKFYSEDGDTQYETIQLTETFEILSLTDDDGNSYDESNFERDEPQTDDNYISQEEWEQQQDDYEELIQKYEESQNGVTVPGVEDVLSGEANGLMGIAVVGFVLVSAVLSALNPLS